MSFSLELSGSVSEIVRDEWTFVFGTIPNRDMFDLIRLRQTDVKAEHFERKVQQLENDKIQLEMRLEERENEMKLKEQELEDTLKQIDNI